MSTPNPFDFPVVVTAAGMQPQDPQDLRDQILAAATANSPGLTANLPGTLVEDFLSTSVPAVALCDQGRVEAVNCLTPDAANEFTLGRLGTIYIGEGQPGKVTNTSVLLVFTGTVGWVVPPGFLAGDGAHLFQVQSGGPIGGGGSTSPLSAIAIQPGSYGVPANTVTQLKSSAPPNITLSVNNPTAGTPGGTGETWSSFRARVMRAGLADCVGGPSLIKTLVGRVPGVQKVSVQAAVGGLRVIVKGGDVYEVAYAIYRAIDSPTSLVGHVAGGTNVTVGLIDSPNTYNILSVAAATQTVTMAVTWNTNLANFTGGGAFPALVQPVLVNYINSIPIGAPINVLEMNELFQETVAAVLAKDFLTRLVFGVNINGTPTAPGTGTYAITGDAESDFFTAVDGSGVVVTQG
jgi:hypothetical protein